MIKPNFLIKSNEFSNLMFGIYQAKETPLDILDIFELYLDVAFNNSNEQTDETKQNIKLYMYNRIKHFGDDDDKILGGLKNIKNIKETTSNIICSLENNDLTNIKLAYEELKGFENNLKELEDDLYTDYLTKLFNKKFMLNYYCDENNKFLNNYLGYKYNIENLPKINEEYGFDISDHIIKLISKTVNQFFLQQNVKMIRIHKNNFLIILENENDKEIVEENLNKIKKLINEKKFFLADKELKLIFNFSHFTINKNEKYETIENILE